MKNIFIVRHAKSNQNFFGNDFERPLNDRGKSDAPMMAKRLLSKKIKPSVLVSSPAVRAKKTALHFAEVLKIPTREIIFITSLYHADTQVFYEVLASLPSEVEDVALFSHNPGITYFVNSLNTKMQVDNMPTCAVFAVSADITEWKDFLNAEKKFKFFDYPKK